MVTVEAPGLQGEFSTPYGRLMALRCGLKKSLRRSPGRVEMRVYANFRAIILDFPVEIGYIHNR